MTTRSSAVGRVREKTTFVMFVSIAANSRSVAVTAGAWSGTSPLATGPAQRPRVDRAEELVEVCHLLLVPGNGSQNPPAAFAMRLLNVVCIWTAILRIATPRPVTAFCRTTVVPGS
jgi:hypothetical protein